MREGECGGMRAPSNVFDHAPSKLLTQMWDLTKAPNPSMGPIPDENAFQLMHSVVEPILHWSLPHEPSDTTESKQGALVDQHLNIKPGINMERRSLHAVERPIGGGWVRRALGV